MITSIVALAIPLLSTGTVHADLTSHTPIYINGNSGFTKPDPAIPLTEINTVIYPTADVYAFGEYGTGYSRTQLKFDISSIPLQGRILSAKLWLRRFAADGWDGGVTLNRVPDQLWGENITASEFYSQAITNEETSAGKFTSGGWDYLDVTDQLNADYGAGNTYASLRLRWVNDNGSEAAIGIDDGRFLVIDGSSFSLFLYSSEYGGSDPYLEIVYVPPYAVSASISPSAQSGANGAPLTYTVTVSNTGNVSDNYTLTPTDTTGWSPSVLPTSVVVPAFSSDNTTTLSVTIPSHAIGGTTDNITVTATGTGDSASVSCTATVAVTRSVSVSISPSAQDRYPGGSLTYTVTVNNLGNVSDNYTLTPTDNAGWSPSVLPTSVVVPALSSDNTTTLSVTIPSGAIGGTVDNITVTANGTGDSSSATCTARAIAPVTGTASIRLATGNPPIAPFVWGIRKVKVTTSLVVSQGDNLKLIFLAYDNVTIESQAVIWSRTAPGAQTVNLTNLIVSHDNALSVNVHRVKLVLTDSAGNVILDNMAWYKAVQDDWGARINWIVLNWSSHNSSQQDQLGAEITQIILGWSAVPTTRDQHDFSQY
jgi:hypothetical protein